MIKRLLTGVLCAVLLLSSVYLPVSGAFVPIVENVYKNDSSNCVSVTFENGKGKKGDLVQIPVYVMAVRKGSGFIGFAMELSYDSDILDFTSAQKSQLLGSDSFLFTEEESGLVKGTYRLPKDKRWGDVFAGTKNPKGTVESPVKVYESVDSAETIDNEIYATINDKPPVSKEVLEKGKKIFTLTFEVIQDSDAKVKINVKQAMFLAAKRVESSADSFLYQTSYPAVSISAGIRGGTVTVESSGEPPQPAKEPMFLDMAGYEWASEYVEYLATRGIIGGVGNKKFAPEKNVKRGDFVKMLAGVSGVDFSGDEYATNKFSDVAKSHSYNKLIGWASAAGVVTGYGDKTFRMDNNITREDMAVMVVRLASYMKLTLPDKEVAVKLEDEAEISAYAKEAVAKLQKAGIIYESMYYCPKDLATRADAAKMLALYMKVYG